MNALTFKNSYLSILVQKSNVIPLLKAKTTIKRLFVFFLSGLISKGQISDMLQCHLYCAN